MAEKTKRERKDIEIAENRSFEGVWIPKRLYITGKFSLRTKFFLIEIKSLSKNGYCYATDKHFADFLGVSERMVQTMIKQLKGDEYLTAEYEYEKGTNAIKRRFLILTKKFFDEFYNEEEKKYPENNFNTPNEKNCDRPIEKNFNTGTEKNCGEKYNTKDNNKNNSNITNSSDTNINALKDVRRSSFKGNIYAPFSEKKGGHGEQNRFIPPDYTYEQLREHIKKPVTDYAKSEYGNDDKAELITEIVIMFCQKYEQIFGNKHPVLSDKAYERIVDRYFDPPEEMCDYDDLETYKTMADRYFMVNFNQQGRYDGEITKSLSHFMSAAIRENLFLQTCR